MAKRTNTEIRAQGGEITHQQHDTDSPIIPVPQLERLHSFRPDAVDWMLQQTEIEATHRRNEEHRTNTYVRNERMRGQICALIIGLSGIIGGSLVALNGQAWAGGLIASFAITGLAVVFIKDRKQ